MQTQPGRAEKWALLAVTPECVSQGIIAERPDGLLLSFGGQTALNCGMALDEAGILAKYNVLVLGTPITAIQATEDRVFIYI